MAGVPPQLPLAEMVTVCAAAGADANVARAKTKAASAASGKRSRAAALPREVRERRLPLLPPILLADLHDAT